MYTAKPQESSEVFTLYRDEEITAKDGSTVIVEKEIGRYSLDQLNQAKESHQNAINDIQEKIDAISSL